MKNILSTVVRFNSASQINKVLTPNEICLLVSNNKDILLLDVCNVGENAGVFGNFKNIINIPYNDLSKKINEIESFKDSEIVIICNIGFQSYRAMLQLEKLGFSNCYSMLGGIRTWKKMLAKTTIEINGRLIT